LRGVHIAEGARIAGRRCRGHVVARVDARLAHLVFLVHAMDLGDGVRAAEEPIAEAAEKERHHRPPW
jgi:hypothetical protein